jgi:hypothetical protein
LGFFFKDLYVLRRFQTPAIISIFFFKKILYKPPLNIQNRRKIPYRRLFQRLPKPPLNDLATPKTTTLENRRNKQIAAVQNRRRLPKPTAADLPFPCSASFLSCNIIL